MAEDGGGHLRLAMMTPVALLLLPFFSPTPRCRCPRTFFIFLHSMLSRHRLRSFLSSVGGVVKRKRERHQRPRDENTQRKRDEKKRRKNKTALDYCSTPSMGKPDRHMNKYKTDAAVSSNTPTHACVRASKYRCVAHTNQTAKQARRVTVYNEHTHTQKVKKRRQKSGKR